MIASDPIPVLIVDDDAMTLQALIDKVEHG
jgi:hypothetical protein